MHAKVPKGNMGCDHHTVTLPDTVAVEPTFVAFFSTGKHKFYGLSCILSNFFEEQCSKLPTIPFGIVACTFSDNLSRNSCLLRASIFKSTNLQSGL